MGKILIIAYCLCAFFAKAQCLTDFTKLLPEPTIDYSQDFGRSIAMYNNYLAVSLPTNDSLGRLVGIVNIYKKDDGFWRKIAVVAPSDPIDALQFGSNMAMSENYLLVSASGYGGSVYIFKKGSGDWTSQNELTKLQVPGSNGFGVNPYGNSPIAISPDEQTIIITDHFRAISSNPYYTGIIYSYHKNAVDEWDAGVAPNSITAPFPDIGDFGRSGVAINGNRLVTGSPYANNGHLFVYYDPSGTFSNLAHEATLSPSSNLSYFLGMYKVLFTDDGIFSSGTELVNGHYILSVLFFQKPPSGSWLDTTPTCFFESEEVQTGGPPNFRLHISTNGTDLIVAKRSEDGSGVLNLISPGPDGWCSPTYRTIDNTPLLPGQITNGYAAITDCNQNTDVVLGVVPIPGNANATLALKTFVNNGIDWETNLLYPEKKSTAGHLFGNTLIGYENHLFVCAPGDGSVRAQGGAVYYFQKVGMTWVKKGKVTGRQPERYDDWFGSGLATNKEYLAVGASGYASHGRVFIYKKLPSGWEDMEMVQEIELPEDILTVYAYGDNIAMSDDWLVIPYVQNSPYRIMLALYKFDGIQWNYSQVIETQGLGNFLFSRSATVAVALKDDVLLAGNYIFERDENDLWKFKAALTPSDPEYAQISPDFSYWISNGSLFGLTNAIDDDVIFIGAPAKDHNGKWDVGAVYVYTKRPDESWSSKTESKKLLPRVQDERELFGYSLKSFGNALIVGAPGSDFNRDGTTARNKPGRAYVFQSRDYYWQDVQSLLDFTGDSFVKDYFGIDVYIDQSDFFISASIEDIATAKLSGSVYVTPAPPIVKLAPPVCLNSDVIKLFGYPFGGQWSGPGITDPNEGYFDPKTVGAGLHELRYVTESCAFEGIMRIEVLTPPEDIELLTDAQFKVCADKPFNIALHATPNLNLQYSWYFRQDANQPFTAMWIHSAEMTASLAGDYQLKVNNSVCAAYLPIINISTESITVTANDPEPVCQNGNAKIQLEAMPEGGLWSGPNIEGNQIDTRGLSHGMVELKYEYTSVNGCTYSTKAHLEVEESYTPDIYRVSGNLCDNGNVTLAVNGNPPVETLLQWVKVDELGQQLLDEGTIVVVHEPGKYMVSAIQQNCTTYSREIDLSDQLNLSLKPEENKAEICATEQFILSVEDLPGADYRWRFKEYLNETFSQISGISHELEVDNTGYYQVEVVRGICEYSSPVTYVKRHEADSVFVPNVITPNGDGKNEVLKLTGNVEDARLTVINRYGKQVFQGSAHTGWNGNVNSGVYFWFIEYPTCEGKHQVLKGDVRVIK
ncbi:MAG: gliding motility-associated C-terminal domain-containing protein [Cyclobacteriaceae bacterium]